MNALRHILHSSVENKSCTNSFNFQLQKILQELTIDQRGDIYSIFRKKWVNEAIVEEIAPRLHF